MSKSKPRARQTGWRLSYEPEAKPLVLPKQIAAYCPSCEHPTLFKFPDQPDVRCESCAWRAPFRDSMPVRDDSHLPVVYYMRMSDLVKIGTTTDLYSRRMVIQPQGVMAVEFGSYELERERHRQFIEYHSHSEWYYLRDELVDHIVRLRSDFESEQGEPIDQWIARKTQPTGLFAVLAD